MKRQRELSTKGFWFLFFIIFGFEIISCIVIYCETSDPMLESIFNSFARGRTLEEARLRGCIDLGHPQTKLLQ